MVPNIKSIECGHSVGGSIIQATLPYNKANYQKAEEKTAAVSSKIRPIEPSISDESDEPDPMRVTTIARYTYELDRYSKNAMLVFEGNASDDAYVINTDNAEPDSDNCINIKQTFEKFRFDVEIYKNLKDDEITRICDRFFQQDFTQYGCVIVMMLAKAREGLVESSHSPNSESGVLQYLSDLCPPTLQHKPKIFIVQTEGYYVIPRARIWSTLPEDTLELRIPVPIVSARDERGKRSRICCLLEHIIMKIDNMANDFDLATILQDAIYEFTRSWQLYDLPVGFYCSLSKELRLDRALET